MMNCSQTRSLSAAYLYGDLSSEESERVETHLSDCDACRAEFSQMDAAKQYLGAFSIPTSTPLSIEIPPVQPNIEKTKTRRWRWIAAAAGIAVLLAIGEIEVTTSSLKVTFPWNVGGPQATDPDGAKPLAPVVTSVDQERRIEALEKALTAFAHQHADDLVTLAKAVDKSRGELLSVLREGRQIRPKTMSIGWNADWIRED